jgi:hypothetical protein
MRILRICTHFVQIAMPYLADLTDYANDPPFQVPATFSGVGRHLFLQKQAFFPKNAACLPPIRVSRAMAGSPFFAEK